MNEGTTLLSRQGRIFYAALLEALVQGMGTAKGYLFHHGPRTAVLSNLLGQRMGLSQKELGDLFFASVLADLGMIGLVEDAWENPVPELSAKARKEVALHPFRSAEAASAIPFLEGAEECIRHHHEWWDGSGYPEALQGEEIPLLARLLRLADSVMALGEPRPQRPALSPDAIREAVRAGAGREFDPDVAKLWLELEEARAIPPFREGIYREVRQSAIEALVPESVSASDNRILLDLFSSLIDAKDPYTGGHSRRVAALAAEVTLTLGLDRSAQERLRTAGYLHDLGKLSVPARILRKTSGLDEMEFSAIKEHAAAGALLLEDVPELRMYAPGARHHHERWDGNGYPERLSGERIPLMARVLAVCDAYDAMTSARAYRPAHLHSRALEEIRRGSGRQFAPREVEAFLSLREEVFADVTGLHADIPDPLLLQRNGRTWGRHRGSVSPGK